MFSHDQREPFLRTPFNLTFRDVKKEVQKFVRGMAKRAFKIIGSNKLFIFYSFPFCVSFCRARFTRHFAIAPQFMS